MLMSEVGSLSFSGVGVIECVVGIKIYVRVHVVLGGEANMIVKIVACVMHYRLGMYM